MIHEASYYIRSTGSFRVACPFNFARARCFNLQFTFTFLLLLSFLRSPSSHSKHNSLFHWKE